MRINPGVLHKAFIQSACFLALSLPVAADQGEKLYSSCASCHGDSGQGNNSLQAPVLAGLDSGYIQRQLQLFKSGARGAKAADTAGAQMRGAAAVLTSEAQIAAVSDYLASLSPATEESVTGAEIGAGIGTEDAAKEADLRNGTNHYQATCGSCHGSQGQGNRALKAPALAGQDTEYLHRQYLNFREGLRGYAADDRPGRQMAMMSRGLSDSQLRDVIAFIGQLSPVATVKEH